MEFIVDDLRDGYVQIAYAVFDEGAKVAPRGFATREILGATIILKNPADALPVGVGRKVNMKIAAAEAVQLIGAFSRPELLVRASPNFNTFREPNGEFWGAYGHRIGRQLIHVWQKLNDDHDTRQAVITLWEPSLDNDPGHADYPCTLSLHFMIRDGALDLHVTMRSNDVYLGLAYDAFQFTRLQLTLANSLGIAPGRYFHHANSLHVYERDGDAIDALYFDPGGSLPDVGGAVGEVGEKVTEAIHRARLLGQARLAEEVCTPSELWYATQLP